jgi:hypothetical protein
MSPDASGDPGDYYESRRSRLRGAQHRRWDRRMQVGVLILAAVAGVVAAVLGTHRSWENTTTTPTTTVPTSAPGAP